MTASVKDLVLDDASTGKYNGTPDGVDGVAAALVCGGKVAAQTNVVPLSKREMQQSMQPFLCQAIARRR